MERIEAYACGRFAVNLGNGQGVIFQLLRVAGEQLFVGKGGIGQLFS